jgi:hypothetical protein
MFPEKYIDNQNIGPFKYRFRLLIFQINYSIDNIDYRLSHGLSETCGWNHTAHYTHSWRNGKLGFGKTTECKESASLRAENLTLPFSTTF